MLKDRVEDGEMKAQVGRGIARAHTGPKTK